MKKDFKWYTQNLEPTKKQKKGLDIGYLCMGIGLLFMVGFMLTQSLWLGIPFGVLCTWGAIQLMLSCISRLNQIYDQMVDDFNNL